MSAVILKGMSLREAADHDVLAHSGGLPHELKRGREGRDQRSERQDRPVSQNGLVGIVRVVTGADRVGRDKSMGAVLATLVTEQEMQRTLPGESAWWRGCRGSVRQSEPCLALSPIQCKTNVHCCKSRLRRTKGDAFAFTSAVS